MNNLHFISNNILTKFFKELRKYKNNYQYYLNYIYRNYIMHIIVYLKVYLCICIGLQASCLNR